MTDEVSEINEHRQWRVAHLRKVIALAEARIKELAVPYEPKDQETGSVDDVRKARLDVFRWAKEKHTSDDSYSDDGDFAKEMLQRLRDVWPNNSEGLISSFVNNEYYTPHDAVMDILWAITAEIDVDDIVEWALGCAGSTLFEEAYILGWNQGYACIQEDNAEPKSF